jgi:membrane fusion protein, multidrug efflux system
MGNVQALATVAVKPLVGGEVMSVHFVEGQEVRKGDLLFTIDPRPYEATARQSEANLAKSLAQVRQAEANLERDSAQAKNATVQAERYRTLVERHLVAQEQYDQVRTAAETLESTLAADRAALENAKSAVQADRAALENAKLQLAYCSIRSPIGGRTGSILIHRGNIVKANDTQVLAVVNQISPVYVVFSLPEKTLSDVRKYMTTGKLRVEARVPNNDKPAEEGVLTFVDNAIDNSTGTIQLKGTFPNKAEHLWPGQFVTTVLTLTTQPNAVVVSNKAIQTGQQGQYVFVVKQDSTVESRPVVVDRVMDDDAVIAKGLNPGETVVVDGQLQLVPGVKVLIKKPQSNGSDGGKPA